MTDFIDIPPDWSEVTGSGTVEAALVLPFFLCAVSTLLLLGQFLLVEANIYHGLLQIGRVYARQESVSGLDAEEHEGQLEKLGGIVEVNALFHNYVKKNSVDSSFVVGGIHGIIINTAQDDNYIQVQASYTLRSPVPFFQMLMKPGITKIRVRKFNGYYNHMSGEYTDGDMVYRTKFGRVYHTRLDCYHLCINITDPDKVKKIMKSIRYKKCDKCIRKGSIPEQLYITKEGDCYHSTMDCSGLKRTVEMVPVESVEGKRICSECGK